MSDNENNSSELSINEPITQDAGLEAIMGMINPKEDLGEIENEPVAEAESEEEYSEEEVDENLDQLEEVEAEESDEGGEELSGDIELDDGEYEYLVNAREYLNENGLRFNLNEHRIWKYIEETFGENRARELSDIFDVFIRNYFSALFALHTNTPRNSFDFEGYKTFGGLT